MLSAVNRHPAGLRHRRANGIGAPMTLVPRRAAAQRHLVRFAQKVNMTHGVNQGAVLIGQHHHALAVANLLEEVGHDGAGISQ